MEDSQKTPYEKPQIRELGSIQQLTLRNKKLGPSDGDFFQGAPIANT
jgi:hypothetical protein